ncbi:ImcF-related family protein [Chromobacterium sp.]|uniref:ImcF-related family protein n=1 Tax=Chromobacterium sp. TaxID=306190 RepID=UPI0035B174EA
MKFGIWVFIIAGLAICLGLFALWQGKLIDLSELQLGDTVLWSAVAATALLLLILLFNRYRAKLVAARQSLLARWPGRKSSRPASLEPSAPSANWAGLAQIAQGWRQRPARQRPHWLLLCGAPEAIHQAAPALAQQPWVETDGMVLIDASATPPPGGWRRLRGRWQPPADAVIALLPGSADAAALAERAEQLSIACGWTLPITLCQRAPDNAGPGIAGWPLPALPANADRWADQLRSWADQLPLRGIPRHSGMAAQPFLLRCSQWLEREGTALAETWQRWRGGLAAAPAFKALALASWPADVRLWSGAISLGSAFAPRRRSRPWQRRLAAAIGALCLIWLLGMLGSTYQNHGLIAEAQATIDAQPKTATLDSALRLQRLLEKLEARQLHGAPWSARFGLNRDAALLERLRPQYARAIDQALIAPARQHWARQLQALNQAPSAELAADPARTEQGYQTLKAYLTLDQPARAEPAFLAAQLTAQASAAHADFSPALLRAMAQFYAERLAGQPGWRMAADPALAQASRQTLIGQLGRQQADDARYQPILAEAATKYPPQTLAALLPGQDLRGLWRSEASLPGVFTRKAWDEHLRAAFADAHRRQGNAGDWVLGAGEAGQPSAGATQDAALRQRYFADYARAWQRFLNDVSWQAETKLAANAQQLQVYADPQRSPLRALMALVRDNARAGERVDSLGANLVDKAQALLGKADASAPARAAAEAAPLAQSFGPLLRLLEERQDGSALSLQRYLERVAATRLKLQQVAAAPDPDAAARALAQAVFQGKGGELAEGRDYAAQLAASLGEDWQGLGQHLFLQPLDQSWSTLLQPAAASLNQLWDQSIVRPWQSSFAGRYPFHRSDADASLPELGRFLHPSDGLVPQFVRQQLGGVLEQQGDQWSPDPAAAQALRFDLNFLNELNRLSRLSSLLYAQGDAGMRFELQPISSPGLAETRLQLDQHSLHDFNQLASWKALNWPGDPLKAGASLQWQTEKAGLRQTQDHPGRWGWLRLLEQAQREQIDRATWQLSWQLPGGHQARYQLRSEAGAGPLALLQLVQFQLPARIFIVEPSKPLAPAKPARRPQS